MKTLLRKTNNRVFDNLLRSQIRRPAASASACPEFDPDRANAYIERGLAGVELARYERHLSGCAGCRTSIVALARMADADSIASPVPNLVRNSGPSESGWLASLKTGLWVIASPRWAIVATALLVIGISIPLLVRRNGDSPITQNKQVAQGEAPKADDSAAGSFSLPQQEPATAAGAARSQQPVVAISRPLDAQATRRENISGYLKKADETTPVVAGDLAAADTLERKSVENGALAGSRDDARPKETADKLIAGAAAPPAAQTKVEENESARKISKDTALKLPPEDTRSASVATLKQGAPDAGPKTEREKEAIAIRSRDSDAPKRKAVLEGESRSGLASGAGGRALIGGESVRSDRAHSPEKTVGKKTFWLSRGVWTDSDYNSDRKLPVVTVVRDSDVYKDILERNKKLKVFLTAFRGTESAIIVFKNTVYSLIPQSENK